MQVGSEDEEERPAGPERNWSESHRLDVFVPSESAAISLMVAKHPARRTASFVAAYLRPNEHPIVISELDVPLPSERWEIRASGLWADHICETPLDHWSYGLEAFALAIDNPDELLAAGLGDRVPLGWELEFEASKPAGWLGSDCYQQLGRAHGIILTTGTREAVDGLALRTHWWGLGGPVELHVGQNYRPVIQRVRLPTLDGVWSLDLGANGLQVRTS